jgi:hypothetical protein
MRLTISLAVAAYSVQAFSVSNTFSRSTDVISPTRSFMSDLSDDVPSDTASEDIVDVQSETLEPTIVSSIFDELPDEGKPVTSVSKEARATINEAILKLEAVNPTEDPTSSPLLNGVWSLRYSGGYDDDWAFQSPTRQIALFAYSGGYSPGLFALSLASTLPNSLVDVGELEISISREQPRIEAKIDVKFLGGAVNDIVVKSRLDTASPLRFTETYESATVLGRTIDLPQTVQYSRDIYIAYLDEDILIVRDGSGVPEILMRKQ